MIQPRSLGSKWHIDRAIRLAISLAVISSARDCITRCWARIKRDQLHHGRRSRGLVRTWRLAWSQTARFSGRTSEAGSNCVGRRHRRARSGVILDIMVMGGRA